MHFRRGPTGGFIATCSPKCIVCCRALLGYYDDPNGPPSADEWAARVFDFATKGTIPARGSA